MLIVKGGPSSYNDGEGISIKLTFIHLQTDPNARSNAKRPETVKLLAMHEDYDLRNFIISLLLSISLLDLMNDLDFFGGSTTAFTLTYDIVGTSDKGITIQTTTAEADFSKMKSLVRKRAKPGLRVVLKELDVDWRPVRICSYIDVSVHCCPAYPSYAQPSQRP